MKHNFDVLTISIYGLCTKCRGSISNRKQITKVEMEICNIQPFAAFKFEELFKQLEEHPCKEYVPEVNQCSE